jgi:hypothetical protein
VEVGLKFKLGDIVRFNDYIEYPSRRGKFRIVANCETSPKWVEENQYVLECVQDNAKHNSWIVDKGYGEYLKSPLVKEGMVLCSEYGYDHSLKLARVKNTELARFMYPNNKVSECGEWIEI